MKKVLTIIAVVVLMMGNKAGAQITLEHTLDSSGIDYNFYVTDIGNNEFKYVILDTAYNGFSLYNMDWSPYLSNIHIPVTDSLKHGFGVMYITKTLFDCDSTNIEYIYENPGGPLWFPFYVFRTDGTLLFRIDSANAPYGIGGITGGSVFYREIMNTSGGTKLFIQKYDQNQVPELLIYGLCGTLPEDVFDFHQQQHSYVKVFPNPTSNTLTFEINPPDNMNEYELVVVDGNAREVKREKVGGSHTYTMDVRDLAGGSYFYSLCTKDRAFGNGKFVINK